MALQRARAANALPANEPALTTPAETAYIEDVAVTYESFGLPRMAGRIMAWLLICNPPHQSQAQLGRVLRASKGSISTMTRMLLQFGLVKRVSLPGDRRDYVAIPEGWLTSLWGQQTQRAQTMKRVAAAGLQVLKDAPKQRRSRLLEMHDMYAFLERETPALVARWERKFKRT
jgi:DNA-binding transcriptional regulator GbsR (MarR family)